MSITDLKKNEKMQKNDKKIEKNENSAIHKKQR